MKGLTIGGDSSTRLLTRPLFFLYMYAIQVIRHRYAGFPVQIPQHLDINQTPYSRVDR